MLLLLLLTNICKVTPADTTTQTLQDENPCSHIKSDQRIIPSKRILLEKNPKEISITSNLKLRKYALLNVMKLLTG